MSGSNNLMETLGIEYTNVSHGKVEAIMQVYKSVCQPFGILHGGASIALAESVAGEGSLFLCNPGEIPVGTQVSCNHISAAKEGDNVFEKVIIGINSWIDCFERTSIKGTVLCGGDISGNNKLKEAYNLGSRI